VTLLCKLFSWSSLCLALMTRVEAQDGQSQARMHHHPPQDQLLHEENRNSKWHMPDHPPVSCSNGADCYPTEITSADDNIYATRSEYGKYIPASTETVERNLDNADGRDHLCAPSRDGPHPPDMMFCFTLGAAT
jgi:hypothetical protein